MNTNTETKAGELTGSRHTPGPWRWEYTQGAGLQIFGQVPFKANCVEFTLKAFAEQPLWSLLGYEKWLQFPPREWKAMQEANARLIAAAPDLLEFARSYLDSESTTDKLDKMAKALIARVEGGAS